MYVVLWRTATRLSKLLGLGLLICKSYCSYSSLPTDPMNISILGNEY